MANLTLNIDDAVLEEARSTAARSGTTVNAIVREHLTNLASREARIARARRRLAELAERSTATIGPAIIAAAEQAGAKVVYTEDLNDGQIYGRVRVTNPFKHIAISQEPQ